MGGKTDVKDTLVESVGVCMVTKESINKLLLLY